MSVLAERNFTEIELDNATTDIVSEWFRDKAGEFSKHALLIAEWHENNGWFTARITIEDAALTAGRNSDEQEQAR